MAYLKYRLFDTSKNVAISYHRDPAAAGRAARRFALAHRTPFPNTVVEVPVRFEQRYSDAGEVSGYGYGPCADENAVDAFDQAFCGYR